MRSLFVRIAVPIVLSLLLGASRTAAQGFEIVGTRALGMGGAFVAVADDATAVYWNPAGLATGPLVDASLQRTATQAPTGQPGESAPRGGWRISTTFFGFALPSLGVSYLRTRVQAALPAPTAGLNDGRQSDRPGSAPVSSLATDQVGLTVLQSLLANLVVGTTLKLTRGATASGEASGSLSAALDEAARLPADAATRFDLDVGVLGFAGPVRVGLVGRNLRRPDFGPAGAAEAGRLPRQVRVGIAVTPGFVVNRTAASRPPLTIAFDADVTRSMLPTGDERHVAAGVEGWLAGGRLGVRAGARASTIGSRRPVATAGASVAIRTGVLVEAQYARGRQAAGQQWSVGGRFAF